VTSTLYKDAALQKTVLRLVDEAEHRGRTVAEIRDLLPNHHHGTLSGVLSVLHAEMRIARLSEKRAGCKIYVHPDFIDGRKAEAQGRSNYTPQEIEEAMALVDFIDHWLQVEQTGARIVTHLTKAERFKPLFFAQLKRMRGVS
jgi:hypothetical protein